MFVLKPSLARNSFCVFLLGICAIAAGTQTPAAAPPQDEKGIATKTTAQAFQSGAAQAAKGAEPGRIIPTHGPMRINPSTTALDSLQTSTHSGQNSSPGNKSQ